jgi:hypothetical protein
MALPILTVVAKKDDAQWMPALHLKVHASAELIGRLSEGVRGDAVEANHYQGLHGKCAKGPRNRPLLPQLRLI